MTFHDLHNGILHVSVDSLGAQLSSLRDAAGDELLWQGGQVWSGRAPVLFPIVGRMPDDELQHGGVRYQIGQHGFARHSEFSVRRNGDSELVFTLQDSEQTRTHFPFGFRLEIAFTLVVSTLTVTHTVTNTGGETFSASLGGHPGFAWPLPGAASKAGHSIVFEQPETALIRRIADGLLAPEPQPSPVVGGTLQLDETLFAEDAIIFDELRSRSVRYSAEDSPVAISVVFPDFAQLGVWMRPPGHYVCIEPWFGMTAPQGFSGEYTQKPGQFTLAQGQDRAFAYSVTVEA